MARSRARSAAGRWSGTAVLAALALIVSGSALLRGTERAAFAQPPPQLPAGFDRVPYPTGLADGRITDFVFLPTGGHLSTGKGGEVAFVSADQRVQRTIARLPVHSAQDIGLLGIALANDYTSSGHVYLVFTYIGTGGKTFAGLSRFTVDVPAAPTSLGAEVIVVDGITSEGTIHNIGTVAVAPDDTIYMGVGDSTGNVGVNPQRLRAQDVRDPHGKILRVLPDGRGVASNPFYDRGAPSSWQSRVWAYGFRMPFRFSLRPGSGSLYVGDVGWGSAEELSIGRPGGNYGWPCWEGGNRANGHRDTPECASRYAGPSAVTHSAPLWWYPRTLPPGGGTSITAGVFYTGTTYPERYRGAFFFGDYARQTLWTLRTDSTDRLVFAPEAGWPATSGATFGKNVGAAVSFRNGPEGDIYYADIGSNRIFRLRYTPGNTAPVAIGSAQVDVATRTVTFTGDRSYDPDGEPVTHRWDLGDGTTSTAANPQHTYPAADTYEVTLTVTDASEASSTTTLSVATDNWPPTVGLVPPPDGTTFAVGEPVELRANPMDAEDGALPDSAVDWEVLLHHCPADGGCHLHPSTAATGTVLRTPFTDHGDDTEMEVVVTVSDSRGAATTESYRAAPRLRTLEVRSDPPGVPLQVNGVTVGSAALTEGGHGAVTAPASYGNLAFAGWSDGGGRSHTVVVPDADLALVARYTPISAIEQRYAELGGRSSFLGAPVGPEVAVAGGRMRRYERGRIYWSAGHGAVFVYGAILGHYLRSGAEAGTLGLPTRDEHSVKGGRASTFAGGHIYWSSATGPVIVKGGMLGHYLRLGGPSARPGLPVSGSAATTRGRVQVFRGGDMYWSPDPRIGTHFVYGSILHRYRQLGGPSSFLGLPTSDEHSVPGGRTTSFVGGRIYWSSTTGPRALGGVILARYEALGGSGSFLGLPRSEVHPVRAGRAVTFARGRIYTSATTGTRWVYGSILGRYLSLGGPSSRLGLPVSDEYSVPGGRRSDFVGGAIVWDSATRTTRVIDR